MNPFKKKKKVLVAEDDTSGALLMSEYLKVQGFDVILAKDGVETIELVEKDPPDLILLDIMMPKMSGINVLTILKSRPGIKSIPILMCTALNTMNEVEDCCRMGAAGYITKPYDLNRVADKIRSVLA